MERDDSIRKVREVTEEKEVIAKELSKEKEISASTLRSLDLLRSDLESKKSMISAELLAIERQNSAYLQSNLEAAESRERVLLEGHNSAKRQIASMEASLQDAEDKMNGLKAVNCALEKKCDALEMASRNEREQSQVRVFNLFRVFI